MRATIEERFWAKVEKGSECWEWIGATVTGYGWLRAGKSRALAHRFSWELANGPIPAGLLVCHRCDNPPCVNPAHLWLGTSADNARDRQAKGRGGSWAFQGELCHLAKMNEAMVRLLRTRAAAGESVKTISRDMGIQYGAAKAAVQRRTWKHVQ